MVSEHGHVLRHIVVQWYDIENHMIQPPTLQIQTTICTRYQVLILISTSGASTFAAERSAIPFWGQFGTNYLEYGWCVPKTGLEF